MIVWNASKQAWPVIGRGSPDLTAPSEHCPRLIVKSTRENLGEV